MRPSLSLGNRTTDSTTNQPQHQQHQQQQQQQRSVNGFLPK